MSDLLSSRWAVTPNQFSSGFVCLKQTKYVLIFLSTVEGLVSKTTLQPSPQFYKARLEKNCQEGHTFVTRKVFKGKR